MVYSEGKNILLLTLSILKLTVSFFISILLVTYVLSDLYHFYKGPFVSTNYDILS